MPKCGNVAFVAVEFSGFVQVAVVLSNLNFRAVHNEGAGSKRGVTRFRVLTPTHGSPETFL